MCVCVCMFALHSLLEIVGNNLKFANRNNTSDSHVEISEVEVLSFAPYQSEESLLPLCNYIFEDLKIAQ